MIKKRLLSFLGAAAITAARVSHPPVPAAQPGPNSALS